MLMKRKKNKLINLPTVRRGGITKRWMINGLGLIFAILVVFEVIFIVAIRFYSYESVRNYLYSRANAQTLLIERGLAGAGFDFESGIKELVENFTEKERLELQAIGGDGYIAYSSSGFTPFGSDTKPPDYISALSNPEDMGIWRGSGSNGEPVMALSMLITDSHNRTVGAVRYVVSLTLVNQQIMVLLLIMLLVGVLIMFFVVLSSSYFVSSIVNPVTEIGRTARKIALGDYNSRIEKEYDDEIGELSDTINYMAAEISAAERMKNDFISSVSHELRTPLTAIRGWSETLRSSGIEDPELMEKGLAVITNESTRLSGIVEELLDFSRMQSDRMTMKFERADLTAELEEAVVLYRERAAREGIALLYTEPDDPAAELPAVYGDGARLRQVFINVIDNAVKYSSEGGQVRVTAVRQGDAIRVTVADSGMGISKADLPKVKVKFFKGNPSRPGSGIGLALADEIVRRHQGSMEIDSVLGQGTTVTIILPAAIT